jgi:hypothetical protein
VEDEGERKGLMGKGWKAHRIGTKIMEEEEKNEMD